MCWVHRCISVRILSHKNLTENENQIFRPNGISMHHFKIDFANLPLETTKAQWESEGFYLYRLCQSAKAGWQEQDQCYWSKENTDFISG